MGAFLARQPVGATGGLEIRPLQYAISLAPGQRQKGFVDITNPAPRAVDIVTSVQAFRQLNDSGALQFYDSAAVRAGITPDFDEFTLGPNETIRLYFVVDGTKLPSGDVFAALFATIKPLAIGEATVPQQTVRVGTILSIVNGTPGARQAVITRLSVGFFQFDTKISGVYTVKNTADPKMTTGFYPSVALRLTPFAHTYTVSSKLVTAGRSRDVPFEVETARFGLYKMTASYRDSSKAVWVLIVSGWYRWATLGVVATVIGLGWWARYHWRHRH